MRFPTISRILVFGGSRSFTLGLILCALAGIAFRLVLLRTPARSNLIAVLIRGLSASSDAGASAALTGPFVDVSAGAGVSFWNKLVTLSLMP